MTTKTTNRILIFGFVLVGLLGVFLRFYHIDFGLPHCFYADEPEIAEPAIKYTYEFKDIVANGNWYKLIPISFVYGTFPTYVFTFYTMAVSKSLNLGHIVFSKDTLYLFMRGLNAGVCFLVGGVGAWLAYRLFKNKYVSFGTFALVSLNWKLIVHAHYLNQDIFLTLLFLLAATCLYEFSLRENDRVFSILAGIFFGLAVGTKITALLSLPMFIYVFLAKKSYRTLIVFLFSMFGAFVITNPFAIIFGNDFAFRIYAMLFKEGGLVFDSVDTNPFKYILGLNLMLTLPILLFSLYGIYYSYRNSREKTFHTFLILNIIAYVVFYSIQSRRVDRWLLPIIPILILYASSGIYALTKHINRFSATLILVLCATYYIYYPTMLLAEFQRQTPKSAAYIWSQQNITPETKGVPPKTLIYTEEGLDPFSKLPGNTTVKMNVYESENAQLISPQDPRYYNYVVISSRPMSNFKRVPVTRKYPEWTKKWDLFESILANAKQFEVIKSFSLPKPNLIPLSDVVIYKNLVVHQQAANTDVPSL